MSGNNNTGLSPLARGTRFYIGRQLRQIRFIPAGAGNTTTLYSPVMTDAVYPRWRGEHPIPIFRLKHCSGLSPLARGTQKNPSCGAFQHRFIPAGAGNTQNLLDSASRSQVYPRWRGEHNGQFTNLTSGTGLSPLARGTRYSAGQRHLV